MTEYFLTVPHDSVEEPTMASMDPAELEATLAAVGAFNAALEAMSKPAIRTDRDSRVRFGAREQA